MRLPAVGSRNRVLRIGVRRGQLKEHEPAATSIIQSQARKAEARDVRSIVRVKSPMRAPSELETRLRRALQPHRISRLTEDFQNLSNHTESLESGTNSNPIAYDSRTSAAYLAFRFLPAFGVIKAALMRAIESGFNLADKPEIKVLDFGAGPGTASWAAYDAFGFGTDKSLKKLEASFVEASMPMIDAAKRLSEGSFGIKWCRSVVDITRGNRPADLARYDIVLATYALNELQSAEARRFVVDVLWRSVAPNGLFLVVERGSPRGAGIVGDVREQILRGGHSEFDVESLTRGRGASLQQNVQPVDAVKAFTAKILAPCGHEHECPMRSTSANVASSKATKNLCYFVQDTDRLLRPSTANDGSSHRSKFSFLAVQKLPEELQGQGTERGTVRILRKPRKNVRHVVLDLCVPGRGVEQVVVPHSSRLRYRSARQAQWGDLFAANADKYQALDTSSKVQAGDESIVKVSKP